MGEYKEVASSNYLDGIRPALEKLGKALAGEYRYYSILATDNNSRTYTVSAGGVGASADPLHTSRGIVVRVRGESGFAEHSFSDIKEKDIDAILSSIRDTCAMRFRLEPEPEELTRGELTETELKFVKNGTYLIHPDEPGDSG
ncbi:MAG: hypothetical protein J5950_01020, partial [Clostridia bacterium]|nr:hypothetical protein [Clostridia bacterium]